MPIKPHPSFPEPGPDERLWRYMEFAKFVSMLTSGGLWFANAAELAKEDPFEGSLPKPHYHQWTAAELPPQLLKQLRGEADTEEKAKTSVDVYLQMMSAQPAMAMEYRNVFLLSCWHSNGHETAAMWKAYGRHDGAVAITSSLSRLRNAFSSSREDLYCGRVSYIDFDTAVIPLGNLFNAITRKRLSFSEEKEVRIACSDFGPMQAENPTPPLVGKLIHCSLESLIEEIWISPTSPLWLADTVEAVCKIAGLQRPIRRSTILDQPMTPPVNPFRRQRD
jgi:hypothetical protein